MDFEEVPGWFDYAPLYDRLIQEAPDNSRIVELGNWHGRSLLHLAQRVRESGKKIQLFGVDWGHGTQTLPDGIAKTRQDGRENTAACLAENLQRFGFSDIVTQIVCSSEIGASLFPEQSLYCVFIDADHTYDSVRRDIELWLPKIQLGGVLAGHDYDWDTEDVKKAVMDFFGKDCRSQTAPICWEVRKE